jgi:hypothetical protein
VSDQFSSLEVVLWRRVVSDHQKRVSTMARERNRHENSIKCDGESAPTQTGQEEELAWCIFFLETHTILRRVSGFFPKKLPGTLPS